MFLVLLQEHLRPSAPQLQVPTVKGFDFAKLHLGQQNRDDVAVIQESVLPGPGPGPGSPSEDGLGPSENGDLPTPVPRKPAASTRTSCSARRRSVHVPSRRFSTLEARLASLMLFVLLGNLHPPPGSDRAASLPLHQGALFIQGSGGHKPSSLSDHTTINMFSSLLAFTGRSFGSNGLLDPVLQPPGAFQKVWNPFSTLPCPVSSGRISPSDGDSVLSGHSSQRDAAEENPRTHVRPANGKQGQKDGKWTRNSPEPWSGPDGPLLNRLYDESRSAAAIGGLLSAAEL